MMGSQKSKRVSWASDVNLCQVRLFLSEDSPSQVSSGSQDHLQAKASWLLHTAGTGPDDHPPGFEGANTENQLKKELAQLSLPKWQCPPRIVLNPYWQVVAGEESNEADIQKERELKVLEAVYPRPSAIPPSPSVSLESGDSHCEDHRIPLIPVTPIEDEDAADHSFSSVASSNIPMISQPPLLPPNLSGLGVLQTFQGNTSFSPNPHINEKPAVGVIPGAEPDVVAAASAAFTAIMRSNEQGSLIDPELLIKILKNPNLMEKLVSDYGIPDNRQTAPHPTSMPMNFSAQIPTNLQTAPKPRSPPMNFSAPQSGSFPVQNSRIDPDTQPPLPTAGHFYPVSNAVTTTLQPRPPPPGIPPPPPPSMKDMSYYKNLIQQHGGERSEAEDQTLQQFGSHHQQYNHQQYLPEQPLQSSKTRDTKPKINKPCLYYNSSRGCKYGANCQFLHDTSYQQRMGGSSSSSSSSMQEAPSAKRMKLDREITGRT